VSLKQMCPGSCSKEASTIELIKVANEVIKKNENRIWEMKIPVICTCIVLIAMSSNSPCEFHPLLLTLPTYLLVCHQW
jgi:hypothetical protein